MIICGPFMVISVNSSCNSRLPTIKPFSICVIPPRPAALSRWKKSINRLALAIPFKGGRLTAQTFPATFSCFHRNFASFTASRTLSPPRSGFNRRNATLTMPQAFSPQLIVAFTEASLLSPRQRRFHQQLRCQIFVQPKAVYYGKSLKRTFLTRKTFYYCNLSKMISIFADKS